ncbi:hypothetical protein SELMODRAFT_271967 [Selaginella moellendorffii]|uniref:NADP-dependent oxidoreductase domain-containing protein n=1 Tax=Selaginella moellendorffii TaxID=88036 RepID=D8SXP8_SELML|nr:probable aldo-keto reductase 4 [Selaginella moellendorffii]EFJ10840.1 hypothetical protein SELMODRAFT_271967 [Selaginella moellendorffii]|eukprot:XP_002988048.1 probable aldo-keto reductase 4 [Selaginella moellendorffii]
MGCWDLNLPHVPRVKLGSQGFEVSKQGLGCASLSGAYHASPPEKQSIELIRHAVESGITFLDTADCYGPFANEILVGKAIRGIRDRVQIATKFAVAGLDKSKTATIRGDPKYVRAACEASLRRLNVDYIDLYYQYRVDPNVPIEVTVGEMKKLVEEGKVKYIGLSEASASTIRRAHAVHPITAVQIEWSLWVRDVEDEIIPTCRELGIGIVAYGPLGRGFFSGKAVTEDLVPNDFRKVAIPRFFPENLARNKVLFDRVHSISRRIKCAPGQLALAWLHSQGDDVVPIPGTTKFGHLEENMVAVGMELTRQEIREIEAAVPACEVIGQRVKNMFYTWQCVSTPPLSTWKAALCMQR